MITPTKDSMVFVTQKGMESIPLWDIYYLESDQVDSDSPCVIHSKDETVVCKDCFEEILPNLGDMFLFCLKRGAVNMQHIHHLEKEWIVLDDGERLEISPFLSDKYADLYCQYLAQRVWED